MRKRGYIRFVVLAMSLALVSGMGLTGCGHKKQVDYGLDEDSETADTGVLLASKLNVPESYKGEVSGISSETGLSAVRIDVAAIQVPETDRMSVQHCSANHVDSEYKKRICENFFDMDEGVYVYDWDKPCKDDLETEIATIQEMSANESDDETKAMYDETLKSLQEDLLHAADEREGAGEYTADTFFGYKNGVSCLASFEEGEDRAAGFSIYMMDDAINYRPKEGATWASQYSSEYRYGMTLSDNTAKISRDAAIDQGMEFLASCGITGVVCTSCCDNLWQYYDQSEENIGNDLDGYKITYKRAVDGVAIYTPTVYGLDSINLVTDDGEDDVSYESENETFTVTIDDKGIFAFSGTDAVRMDGEREDNVELLPWDDILKVLPDAVNSFYTENKTHYSEINFNDVRLTYFKIKEGDGYKYAPVWVFSECSTEDDGTISEIIPPSQIIMLDAQNGQLIDMISSFYRSEI